MSEFVDAIYESGAFRPIDAASIELPEGARVRLAVQPSPISTDEFLELAASVYEGLSEQDIKEIEEIATDRSIFFSKPPPTL